MQAVHNSRHFLEADTGLIFTPQQQYRKDITQEYQQQQYWQQQQQQQLQYFVFVAVYL